MVSGAVDQHFLDDLPELALIDKPHRLKHCSSIFDNVRVPYSLSERQRMERVRKKGSNAHAAWGGPTVLADPAENLGPVGTRIGYLLHRADLQHMRAIQAMLSEIGLTATRATALSFIHENPGCGQSALGSALDINRASTMEVVNALVALNAVERRNSLDRRRNALFVTAQGEALFDQFNAISLKLDQIIISALSPEEAQHLARMLVVVRNATGSPEDHR